MAESREHDIVIYGATGFTGKLVAEYMVEKQGHGLRWAMAGRSVDKLAAVRDELGAPADTPLIVADASDPASIKAMASSTRCVVTTVGPYQMYGTPLVAACAELGTHYVDLTGEPGWMHETIATFSDQAKASGARIVHSCGFDSIPFDLGVLYLQNIAQEKFGKPCQSVKARVRSMNGEFSGGTAASLNATEAAVGENPDLLNVLLDPFSLTEGFTGPAQPADNKPMEDPDMDGAWVAPFIMAIINSKNVHRSNALMGHPYGEDFTYNEMMFTGPGDNGKAAAEFVASHNPLQGEHAPAPGTGPSKEARENGNYDILFIGKTADGEEIRCAVSGDLDPGYGSTSRMLAESAVCLIEESTDLAGGLYTPAPAMGEKLIKRLVDHAGLTFKQEA